MAEKFYLGKIFDPAANKVTEQPLQYDPDDLTTHGVVVGMTGSGKTGLCITMMEEAALQGIPAILIDPKGDLTNLLLHFPDLAPQDFRPWLDPELARRAGKSMEQASEDAALAWRNGLAEWGISQERMLALKNSAQFAVYTPGSDAGIPVSVLSSLAAPGLEWAGNREILTERIGSTVTALLGLVGFDELDPLRSREHILLANIFQTAWSHNRSLDLNELILQIQTPPFEKLGAFPVDAFFPPRDRMALALQLNNILAAPTFELWRIGQPLDIPALLRADDGRPRHSVFYLAHLSDSERMFFVTLLLTAVESWMRTQTGATSLRALLYMDEIFGYLPPTEIPPSKQPLLRMLKQARAFGLGLLLATQNPVDIDYKALSNAGTWFIGKLQTERDKLRLLDGLESAASGTLNRGTLDKMISGLGKRVFIMNNIHGKEPVLFQTRWAMNFLAGPMTRAQIPALNKLAGAGYKQEAVNTSTSRSVDTAAGDLMSPQPMKPAQTVSENLANVPEGFEPIPTAGEATAAAVVSQDSAPERDQQPVGSMTHPLPPTGIAEFFLPMNISFMRALENAEQAAFGEALQTGLLYRPALIASAQVRFLDRKYGLDTGMVKSVLVPDPDKRGVIRWDDFVAALPDMERMDPAPDPQARFSSLDAPLSDARLLAALERDFSDWVYRASKITIRANQALGIFATPEVGQAEFMKACTEAAKQRREEEMLKATAAIDRKIKILEDKIAREERELNMDETELSQRKGEELATHAENVLGVFGGRRSTRRLSSSLSKHRMTEQAREDVDESIKALNQYDQEMQELEESRQQALDDASAHWENVVSEITQIPLMPKKTDIYIQVFGVAWMPYYQVESTGGTMEVPAFGT
jgi:hypothetical protein